MSLYVIQLNGPDHERGRVLSGPHDTYAEARGHLRAHIRFGVSLGIVDHDGAPVGHHEDPGRPGFCEVCRGAYPCPGTATPDETRKLLARYGH